MGQANLRKKEKNNWITSSKKKGVVGDNLRKKEKTNDYWWLKQRMGQANLRKKEKTNGLVGA